jgi:nucleotidyltransferase/DNA polymerase involved in DNA repair
MVSLDADDVATYLDSLPVERLKELEELELDDAMVERLGLFGLGTVGRLRRLTHAQLTAQFGMPGARVHELLRSIGDPSPLPLHVPPPTCEGVVLLDDGTNEPALLEAILRNAVEEAVAQLGNRRTGRVEIALLDKADQPVRTSSRILRAPTTELRHLLAQTSAMLAKAVGGQQFFGVRVRLGALALIPPSQTSLFPTRPTLTEVTAPMARRFPQAIKRVTIIDAHAYLPDRFASIEAWKPVA